MQHQYRIMATDTHGIDDRITHRQPVVLLHVGTVEQWVQFLECPGDFGGVCHHGEVIAHAGLEAAGWGQAFRRFEHADGATGVEHEEVLYCAHGKRP